MDTGHLIQGIGSRADVARVEANGLIHPLLDSTAQYYATYQWALKNTGQTIGGPNGPSTGTVGADIKAYQAWNLTTGSRNIVLATIDPTGIDYTHPDLSLNIWSAPSSYTVTIAGVQYTCPAGSHGFQFDNSGQGPCDPLELSGQTHGTILAGIMGANGASSIGVAGINWSTSIIHVVGVSDADVINGIDFLIQTKNHFGSAANIMAINNSYELGDGANQAVLQEINVANSNGILFVAAAGNGGGSNDPPGGTFPASFGASPYNAPNVISVANTDNNDNICAANCPGVWLVLGAQSVHLAAPGFAIASTLPGGGYNVSQLSIADLSTGTSASSPYVVGTAGLVLSRCADLTTAQLKQDLLDNVDFVAGLYGCFNTSGQHDYCTITRGTTPSGQQGGGRLNAYKAVSACGYALTVAKNGAGSGTVTSNTSGTIAGTLVPINCGSTCSAVFKSSTYGGAAATLTATPAAGSAFTGWSGACGGTGTCVISSTSASEAVTATFGPVQRTLTLNVSGSGSVTSPTGNISCSATNIPGRMNNTCTYNFAQGTVITLTEHPTGISTFSGWSGSCSGTTTTCTVTMNGNLTVSARWNVD